MPNDTTTPETTADTTADRTTAAAGDKLWAALHARPDATAEELANHAGIGRSTAAKILSRWVDDGTVDRTPGAAQGKRSAASRFAIATPAPAPTAAAPADDPDVASGPHSGTDGVDNTIGDGAVTDDAALPAGDHTAVADEAGAAACEAELTSQAPGVDGGERATSSDATSSTFRLAPGALHGMVEDYLRDHPDDEFGPTKIGHDLGRSSGAVSNALERLVASGHAVRSNDRPKRYRLAPTAADATPEG
jgi:DNA-binding MarR family transcriptional regulator